MVEGPKQLHIGEFTIAFLTDGIWRNDGGCMFGGGRASYGNASIRLMRKTGFGSI